MFSIVTEARDQTLPGSLLARETLGTRLCRYVACSARAPAQHCWMCCANERNIVGPRFDDRETIEMLALVGSEV